MLDFDNAMLNASQYPSLELRATGQQQLFPCGHGHEFSHPVELSGNFQGWKN